VNSNRRDFFKSAATAALTTQIFTGNLRGANDKLSAAFIGMGKMGRSNLSAAMRQENVVVSAVCDVFDRNLDMAVAATKGQARGVRDFREILADKSIDVGVYLDARSLARLHDRRSLQGRQGRVRRKAHLRDCRRGREDGAGGAQVQASGAGRNHAALGRSLSRRRSKSCAADSSEKSPSCAAGITGTPKPEGIGNPPDAEAAIDAQLGHVAGPCAEARVQRESLSESIPTTNTFSTSAGSGITPAA
jgi:hypothetical protein